MQSSVNIAQALSQRTMERPEAIALRVPRRIQGHLSYADWTFQALSQAVDAVAHQMVARGIRQGCRVLIMVPPGQALLTLVFALFKVGAVPVVIDPGLGLRHYLRGVERSRPVALIGTYMGLSLSYVMPRYFRSVCIRVHMRSLLESPTDTQPFVAASVHATDLAAILFTSGSTGAPKGVCYQHAHFQAQLEAIRTQYAIQPGEVDLPLLPVFSLFNPALGVTTIVPEMNPKSPKDLDPAKAVEAIQVNTVTSSFGSPRIWGKIADYCQAHALTLPSIRRILMAGASVPTDLVKRLTHIAPNALIHTPYGATECLPIASIDQHELFSRMQQSVFPAGICVGRPLSGVTVRVLEPTRGPMNTLEAADCLPPGTIGEMIVRGPMVTQSYDGLPEANALAKIPNGAWHRMGDLGYQDHEGFIWLCGRKAESFSVGAAPYYPDICEAVFNGHPGVARSALICHHNAPAIVVEPKKGHPPSVLRRELERLAQDYPATRHIHRFFFVHSMPVDVRHNTKIHRLALTRYFNDRVE